MFLRDFYVLYRKDLLVELAGLGGMKHYYAAYCGIGVIDLVDEFKPGSCLTMAIYCSHSLSTGKAHLLTT